MQVLIVCKSVHHSNTRKIAETIAEELNAEVIEPENVDKNSMENYDIIGFGSGIYFLAHHRDLLEFIDKIFPAKRNCFVFSTKGFTPTLINHSKIKRKLREKGFNIVGEFSCRGYDSVGPLKFFGGINKNRPNDKDIKRAREFAKNLLNRSTIYSIGR